jgi:hypothetical protein
MERLRGRHERRGLRGCGDGVLEGLWGRLLAASYDDRLRLPFLSGREGRASDAPTGMPPPPIDGIGQRYAVLSALFPECDVRNAELRRHLGDSSLPYQLKKLLACHDAGHARL